MLDLLTDRGWLWTAALFYLAVFIAGLRVGFALSRDEAAEARN